ncbi:MAG: PEP-CTERM sorting domain-containing protein [Nitrospira sp.]|nr:PEP-CTERM sorting domain-containing protein [bacterium]MBL7047933.1 PEP-CTERM sorting domain-containing protein [Nitrospira sp.]
MKKKLFVGLVLGLFFIAMTEMVNANVLTFDDISFPGDTGQIPDSYVGLTWSSAWRVNDQIGFSAGQGFMFGAVSGSQTVFNGWGADVTIVSNDEFIFKGAYLTSAYNKDLNIQIIGKNNGVTLYDTSIIAPVPQTELAAFSAKWFQFDYSGIDELQFSSFGGTAGTDVFGNLNPSNTHFVMDNFIYVPVPEPATVLLLGAGLAGLVCARIKRKEK